ncbi:MAG: hypothetical protein JW834_03835 [Candidatus Diapherotrites archaeon]|nr:hypothetical protein [Candidatus Diapherotrites archaeon]
MIVRKPPEKIPDPKALTQGLAEDIATRTSPWSAGKTFLGIKSIAKVLQATNSRAPKPTKEQVQALIASVQGESRLHPEEQGMMVKTLRSIGVTADNHYYHAINNLMDALNESKRA